MGDGRKGKGSRNGISDPRRCKKIKSQCGHRRLTFDSSSPLLLLYFLSFPGGNIRRRYKTGRGNGSGRSGGDAKSLFSVAAFSEEVEKKHFMASNTGTATVSKFFLFFLFNPEKERKIGTIEMPRPFLPAPKRHKRRLPIKGGDP